MNKINNGIEREPTQEIQETQTAQTAPESHTLQNAQETQTVQEARARQTRQTRQTQQTRRLIIIGASGHGRVVADIAVLNGYQDIVFLDGDSSLTSCAGYPVVGSDTMADEFEGDLFIAIGDADIRERLMNRYRNNRSRNRNSEKHSHDYDYDYKHDHDREQEHDHDHNHAYDREHRNFPILVHPKAVVAHDVRIGAGSVIMAGAVINPGARIGRGVIINTSSSIDHDCEIGDFVHIAVGAHLSGTVRVGDKTWIGTGVIVSNNVNICCACTLCAGAVVIRDIEIPGIYIGVPAMLYKKNDVRYTDVSNTLETTSKMLPPPREDAIKKQNILSLSRP